MIIRLGLTFALLIALTSSASAQIVYVQSPPVVYTTPAPVVAPVVSYSYYPSAPVVYPQVTTSYYAAPAPTVAYYPPVVAAPAYGLYSSTTTTGLGIFRPRQVTTQYYYAPILR